MASLPDHLVERRDSYDSFLVGFVSLGRGALVSSDRGLNEITAAVLRRPLPAYAAALVDELNVAVKCPRRSGQSKPIP